jgi:hypothetical protein
MDLHNLISLGSEDSASRLVRAEQALTKSLDRERYLSTANKNLINQAIASRNLRTKRTKIWQTQINEHHRTEGKILKQSTLLNKAHEEIKELKRKLMRIERERANELVLQQPQEKDEREEGEIEKKERVKAEASSEVQVPPSPSYSPLSCSYLDSYSPTPSSYSTDSPPITPPSSSSSSSSSLPFSSPIVYGFAPRGSTNRRTVERRAAAPYQSRHLQEGDSSRANSSQRSEEPHPQNEQRSSRSKRYRNWGKKERKNGYHSD